MEAGYRMVSQCSPSEQRDKASPVVWGYGYESGHQWLGYAMSAGALGCLTVALL